MEIKIKMNNTYKEIAEQLKKAQNILILTHVGVDGDGIGSAVSVCKALRMMGKTAYVLMEDEIPDNLSFMLGDYVTYDMDIIADDELDVTMCVDCGDETRFPERVDKFRAGKVKICVDHHGTTEPICDYNYIDPAAAACGELIFELLKELGVTPDGKLGTDKEIGEALFAAITTDTGNFQYSNTTKRTHEITAELYDWGIDANKVSVEIYENMRPQKLIITNKALDNLEMIAGGKGAVAYVSKEEQEAVGAKAGETEEVVQKLRSIAGVEYAAFLKEKDEGVIRVSLRAKRNGDVSVIAKEFGGGGHTKAAGCTLNMSLEEGVAAIKAAIEREALKNE